MAEADAAVERRVWLACAPPLTRNPDVGAFAYYYPRGHAHQCDGDAPTGQAAEGEGKFLCVITSVDLLARGDEVYARIALAPVDDAGEVRDYALPQLKHPGSRDAGDLEVALDARDRMHFASDSGGVCGHARGGMNSGDVRDAARKHFACDAEVLDIDSVDLGDHARRNKQAGIVLDKDRYGSDKVSVDLLDHALRDKEAAVVRDTARRDLMNASDICGHARPGNDSGDILDPHASVDNNGYADRKLLTRDPSAELEIGFATDHGPRPVELAIFPKLMSATDVNVYRGSGPFHVPKPLAAGILPPLRDVAGEAGYPKQTLRFLDLGGVEFEFNHVHSGSGDGRRQHLLTKGWNHFVHTKRAKKGDVVLFMRFGGQLRITLLRSAIPAAFVSAHDVAEATLLAKDGKAFNVVWCPRRGAEFVVPRKEVQEALAIDWTPGTRVSCSTGVVRPGVVHRELPHKVTTTHGTIKAVHQWDWQKLHVEWDLQVQRPGSAGTSTASSAASMSSRRAIRLFGVDIRPAS